MTEEGKEIISTMKEMFGVLNDKIDNVQAEVSGLKQDVSGLKQDVSSLKQDVSSLKQDVSEIKQRVTKIETTLENETNRNITLLVDGYIQNSDKLDALAPVAKDVEVVKFDVSIIKAVVTTHSSQLQKLEKAN